MNSQSNLNGILQILGRIRSIDQRIDEVTGNNSSARPLPPEMASSATVSGEISSSSFSDLLQNLQTNLPPRANHWIVEDAIKKASQATGVDLDLIRAVMQAESGGNSNAVSKAGAQGLMQLMPQTAEGLGVTNPFDPHQNAMGGAKYLKQQLDKFGGNISLALAAYNAGPHAVEKYSGIPPYKETINYVNTITANYRNMKNKFLIGKSIRSDLTENT